MKWMYLPAVFALAFFYTKTSFTHFLPQKVSMAMPAMRKPASLVENRKPGVKRTTPSDMYKILATHGVSSFADVASFKGVIVSDAHVENFGFVIGDNKKSQYTIMDFSEISQGQLYLDVITHLVSSKAVDKNISWMQYFEAYKKGLKREAHTNSFYVLQGNENALANSEIFIQQNIGSDHGIKFQKLKKGYHSVENKEKVVIEKELKKHFSKAEFFDMKESDIHAGSYHVLARLRPLDKVQWVILREKKESDHDEVYGHEDIFTTKGYQELLKVNIYSGHLDRSLMVLTIDSKPFVLKYAEQFATKLTLEEIPFEDYQDIILDQAYALGLIHSTSLGSQVDNYIKGWAKIPAAIIDEKAVEFKHSLRDQ